MMLRRLRLSAILLMALPVAVSLAQDAKPPTQESKRETKVEHHLYRLAYTLTEFEGEKKVGVQHVVMNAGAGMSTAQIGSKVPVSGGSAQGTYYDVGLNVRANVMEDRDSSRLFSSVEQSSVPDLGAVNGSLLVIRQTKLESSIPLIAMGKPVVLGSFDIPGTTRRIEVTLLIEVVF